MIHLSNRVPEKTCSCPGRHRAVARPFRLPARVSEDVDPVPDGSRHHRHGDQLGQPRQVQLEAVEEHPYFPLWPCGNGSRSVCQHAQHSREIPGRRIAR